MIQSFTDLGIPYRLSIIRVKYFHDHTDNFTLVVYPIVFGVIFAILAPWVKFIAATISEFPTRKLRLLQDQSAHKIIQMKNQLAAVRENEKAIYEQSLIDQAKRDQEISEIEDEGIKTRLEENIKKSRNQELPFEEFDVEDMPLLLRIKPELWISQERIVFFKSHFGFMIFQTIGNETREKMYDCIYG